MPDLDKLIRSVGDSLSGTVIRDDSRIIAIHAQKLYADSRGVGAVIRVNTLPKP
jgi:Holliday junction resolvase RusA-like endonuclease